VKLSASAISDVQKKNSAVCAVGGQRFAVGVECTNHSRIVLFSRKTTDVLSGLNVPDNSSINRIHGQEISVGAKGQRPDSIILFHFRLCLLRLRSFRQDF
jgi:hypothetical protein